MSYSKKTIAKVMERFQQKPIKARELATMRRIEIQNRFADIKAIDDKLAETSCKVYAIIALGTPDAKDHLARIEAENQASRQEPSACVIRIPRILHIGEV